MAVNATAVWRVRPGGSNTNGGGYDAGIGGAGTDYSQQNAAQASGTNGTATGTTTFIDATANAFTSAMVGNAIWIASGAGFTVGAYFVTAFTSASTVTLDRSPGTGTVAVWALGGAWADFWTNTTSSGPLVSGNIVYILGSGTPNPSSYSFDYTSTTLFTPQTGNATNGYILFANDPATPGYKAPPDTTGGMPCIKTAGLLAFGSDYTAWAGLYLVASSAAFATDGIIGNGVPQKLFGCILDQNSFDIGLGGGTNASCPTIVVGCEVFSSVAPGGAGSTYAFYVHSSYVTDIFGCNIHDTVGGGIHFSDGTFITSSIISNCRGAGVFSDAGGGTIGRTGTCGIRNCTIDGNTGNGIEFNTQLACAITETVNNIISNHTGAGKFGMTVDAGTTAQNDRVKGLVDYNTFYNNTSNYNAISAGAHDTALSKSPYVNQSTENYTLA